MNTAIRLIELTIMKKVLLLALCVVLWQTLEAQKISKERLPITVEAGFGIFNTD